MGFENLDNGDGYIKFDKGANALATIKQIDQGKDSYKGNEYCQLEMKFRAQTVAGDQEGTIPAWPASKITIKESDEHTSMLGIMLREAGVLEQVLRELGADDNLVEAIMNGDQRYIAETEEENIELMKAVATHIDQKVLKVGTKWNSKGEYSIVKEFHELVEENPFDGSEDEGSDSAMADSDVATT